MNPKLTEVSKATQWKPGVSGNPNGRAPGSRQAFSSGFLKDLAEVWQAEGRGTMLHTAKTKPATIKDRINLKALKLLESCSRLACHCGALVFLFYRSPVTPLPERSRNTLLRYYAVAG